MSDSTTAAAAQSSAPRVMPPAGNDTTTAAAAAAAPAAAASSSASIHAAAAASDDDDDDDLSLSVLLSHSSADLLRAMTSAWHHDGAYRDFVSAFNTAECKKVCKLIRLPVIRGEGCTLKMQQMIRTAIEFSAAGKSVSDVPIPIESDAADSNESDPEVSEP